MTSNEKILKELEERGTNINENSENLFSPPYLINLSFSDFISLSQLIIDSHDNINLFNGYLSSFPLYILQNIYKFKNESEEINAIWEIFLNLSEISSDVLSINMMCSVLSNIILKTQLIPENVLDYISSSDTQNHLIKPFYLSILHDILPDGYILSNRNYFIQITAEAFPIATISQRNNFLQFIIDFDFEPSELLKNEGFWEAIWTHLIDICFSDRFDEDIYYMAMKILDRYENKHKDIIDIENLIIGSKINYLEEISEDDKEGRFYHIKRSMLLIPYMNPQMVHFVLKHAYRLTTDYINAFSSAPKINEIRIVSNVLSKKTESPISDAICEQLKVKARYNRYHEGATYLLSLFLPSFQDQTKVVSTDLRFRIKEIFSLSMPHYDVIMNCIKFSAHEANGFKELLKNMIQKLFKLTKEDAALLIPFFKMLKSLIRNDYSIDSFLTLLVDNLNALPVEYLDNYFKVFNEMIFHVSDIEYKTLFLFLSKTVEDEKVELIRKGYAIISIDEFSARDDSQLLSLCPVCFPIIDQLLRSEYLELSILSVDFINDAFLLMDDMSQKEEFHDFAVQIFQYLLSIAGDEEHDPKLRRISARSAVVLAKNYSNGNKDIIKDFIFPIELAESFILTEDLPFITCSLFLFRKIYLQFPEDHILQAFDIVSKRSFHEISSVLTNETLNFASVIIKNIDKVPECIIEYLNSLFLGRFLFFDGLQMIDYSNKDFKIFKVIKALCERQIFNFIGPLVSWFSFMDPINFEKASSAVLTYFEVSEMSDDEITEKWNYFNTVFSNNLMCNESQYIIHILLVLYEKGYEYLDPSKFISSLYYLWDEGDDTNQELLSDSIIFVLAHSKEPIEKRNDIFSKIFDLLIKQDIDVDYERICLNCLSLFDERAQFYSIEREVLCFIASIVTKNKKDILKLGENLPLEEMVECLGKAASTKPDLAKAVLQQFERIRQVEEQLERLRQLFSTPQD